jgi:triosephosphate isomerase
MILAANFKMNHTRASTRLYMERLAHYGAQEGIELFVFPPATALDRYEAPAAVGAQNAYPAHSGSYTGEIGAQQLEEFGVATLLLGHSERRHLLGEHQELIAKKFAFYKELGYTLFVCVGETLEVRESGSVELMRAYLLQQLEGIDLEYEKLVVAYEPVWAIGTGKSAEPEQIAEVLAYLRTLTPAPLLYGGSVKPDNIVSILNIENCDGALVGSASWDVERFIEMIERAKERV